MTQESAETMEYPTFTSTSGQRWPRCAATCEIDTIPRAEVADALNALLSQAEAGTEKWFGHHSEANIYQDFAESITTTMTALGLGADKKNDPAGV